MEPVEGSIQCRATERCSKDYIWESTTSFNWEMNKNIWKGVGIIPEGSLVRNHERSVLNYGHAGKGGEKGVDFWAFQSEDNMKFNLGTERRGPKEEQMKKNIIWVLLSLILISFLVLFGNSSAMAADYPYPTPLEKCTLSDNKGILKAGYTIEKWPCQATGESTTCVQDEWPIKRVQLDGITVFYDWRYKWSGIVSANQVSMVAPICVPTKIIYYPTLDIYGKYVDGTQVYTNGDPTTGFGIWDCVVMVLRNPNIVQNGNVFSFITKSDQISQDPLPVRNTYMQLKSSTNLYYCRDIAGPDCPSSEPFAPMITTTDLQFPDPANVGAFLRFRYLRDANSCIVTVQKFDASNGSYVSIPWDSGLIGGAFFLNCGSADASGRCNDCLIEVAGSPHKKQSCTNGQCVTLYTFCNSGEKSILNTNKTAVSDCVHLSSESVCNVRTSQTTIERCCTSPTTGTGCYNFNTMSGDKTNCTLQTDGSCI